MAVPEVGVVPGTCAGIGLPPPQNSPGEAQDWPCWPGASMG